MQDRPVPYLEPQLQDSSVAPHFLADRVFRAIIHNPVPGLICILLPGPSLASIPVNHRKAWPKDLPELSCHQPACLNWRDIRYVFRQVGHTSRNRAHAFGLQFYPGRPQALFKMVLIDPDHQRAMEIFISPFTVSGLSRYLPAFHKDIIPSGKYRVHT